MSEKKLKAEFSKTLLSLIYHLMVKIYVLHLKVNSNVLHLKVNSKTARSISQGFNQPGFFSRAIKISQKPVIISPHY